MGVELFVDFQSHNVELHVPQHMCSPDFALGSVMTDVVASHMESGGQIVVYTGGHENKDMTNVVLDHVEQCVATDTKKKNMETHINGYRKEWYNTKGVGRIRLGVQRDDIDRKWEEIGDRSRSGRTLSYDEYIIKARREMENICEDYIDLKIVKISTMGNITAYESPDSVSTN